jgi:hypothetical protein
MGQYYKAVFLDSKTHISPHFYSNGAKLTEHSWIKNDMMMLIESYLHKTPERIVWAGDYAELEEIETEFYKHSINIDGRNQGVEPLNLYSQCDIVFKEKDRLTEVLPRLKYIINHTKKEFVNKSKVYNDNGWKVHPLSILVSEGNGQGGGDYTGNNMDLAGVWARDLISTDSKKPKGYKEIIPDFREFKYVQLHKDTYTSVMYDNTLITAAEVESEFDIFSYEIRELFAKWLNEKHNKTIINS